VCEKLKQKYDHISVLIYSCAGNQTPDQPACRLLLALSTIPWL